jgi:hypothetical protein
MLHIGAWALGIWLVAESSLLLLGIYYDAPMLRMVNSAKLDPAVFREIRMSFYGAFVLTGVGFLVASLSRPLLLLAATVKLCVDISAFIFACVFALKYLPASPQVPYTLLYRASSMILASVFPLLCYVSVYRASRDHEV